MDEREKELVAVGAAVTANCVPCLKHHLEKARDTGVSDQDIAEAIRVGRMVRAGSARAWDEAAAEVFPAGAARE